MAEATFTELLRYQSEACGRIGSRLYNEDVLLARASYHGNPVELLEASA